MPEQMDTKSNGKSKKNEKIMSCLFWDCFLFVLYLRSLSFFQKKREYKVERRVARLWPAAGRRGHQRGSIRSVKRGL